MTKRKNSPAETILFTAILFGGFIAVACLLVGCQWLTTYGPTWMLGETPGGKVRIGAGIALAVPVLIAGVICICSSLMGLFDSDSSS